MRCFAPCLLRLVSSLPTAFTTKNAPIKGASFYYGAGSGIVLDFLHAHRVSFSVLCTCQLHLFAIRHKCRTEIRSNSTNAYAFCGFSPSHTQIKKTLAKANVFFMGRVVGLFSTTAPSR